MKLDHARWLDVGLVVVAFIGGLALARLPALSMAAVALGIAVLVATLIEPLIGLGLTLIAAPFVAVERLEWGLPLDSGQMLLMLTLGAWLLRGLARREIFLPLPIALGRREANLLRVSGRGEHRSFAPLTIPLLVFTGAAALSLWSAFSVGPGLTELLKWIEVIAVYLLVVQTVDRKRLPWLIGMVLLAALVQAGIGLWQFGLRGYGPEHFLIPGTSFYRAYGAFEQPNPFAGYLGLTLPLAIGLFAACCSLLVARYSLLVARRSPFTQSVSSIRRPTTNNQQLATSFLLLAVCSLLAAALVASWSRGAWLGAAAAIAVMAAFWPRRWWLGVGIVAVVAALILGGSALGVLPSVIRSRLTDFTQYIQVYDVRGVGVNDANYAVLERLAHWQAAVEMIRWHLWTGVGLGNYEVAYNTYRLLNWPYALGHAHNYLLNITAETGVPGLLAYIFLWGAIFWRTFRALGRTSGWQRGLALGLLGVWVHLLVHNMFDNLYVSNLWIHLAVLLGLLTQVESGK